MRVHVSCTYVLVCLAAEISTTKTIRQDTVTLPHTVAHKHTQALIHNPKRTLCCACIHTHTDDNKLTRNDTDIHTRAYRFFPQLLFLLLLKHAHSLLSSRNVIFA